MTDRSKPKMFAFYVIMVGVIVFFGLLIVMSVYFFSNHTDLSGGLVTFLLFAAAVGVWVIKNWRRGTTSHT